MLVKRGPDEVYIVNVLPIICHERTSCAGLAVYSVTAKYSWIYENPTLYHIINCVIVLNEGHIEHNGAQTKWPPTCRRHFQNRFIEWKMLLRFDSNLTDACFFGSKLQYVNTGSDNGLLPLPEKSWLNRIIDGVTGLQWVNREEKKLYVYYR